MADKKSQKKKAFKDLKEFKKSLPSQSDTLSPAKPEPTSSSGLEEKALTFEEEMRRLGVTPRSSEHGGDEGDFAPSSDAHDKEAGFESESVPPPSNDLPDEELFLSALKNFDKVFEEEDFSAFSELQTPPLTKKFNKKRIVPDRQIDLHGLTRKEALLKVHFFLQNCAYAGLKTVLIITGRGHGSDGEAVLRQAVEEFLAEEGQPWVSSWERAPRKFGGEGALAIFLKEK
ncbi:MAG: Smr/MutS family protein [Deltaproteobacteria bacterium]|nr:Smr/MutS family protein [Deltaproteobacteria bacterium]